MREDDSNWFSKWEDELPPPDELISLSQTLITPDLASAFDIRSSVVNTNNIINNTSNNNNNNNNGDVPISFLHHHQQYAQKQHHQSNSAPQQPPPQPNSSEFDSSSAELCGGGGATSGGGGGGGGGGGAEEPARTLKRPRLVWTPQLHKRFVDAVAHLGIKNAVPKTIMQLMSVDGLTRENVASHLQKYRLYLKRVNGGGPGLGPAPGGSGDAATDHLFASSPVPPHFLQQNGPGSAGPGAGGGGGGGRPGSDHFMPYMPVAALNHHQMAAAVVGHQQIQAQYQQQHRQMGHFGSSQSVGGGGGGGGGQFEHPFLSRQAQLGPNRNGLIHNNSGFVEDVESATANNGGRKVLTLFPDGDDS